MRTETREMTVADFLTDMKDGWGFRSPGTVMSIGRALERDIRADASAPITVTYQQGSGGDGPNSYYSYSWRVVGIPAPDVSGNKLTAVRTGWAAEPVQIANLYRLRDGSWVVYYRW